MLKLYYPNVIDALSHEVVKQSSKGLLKHRNANVVGRDYIPLICVWPKFARIQANTRTSRL